MAVTKKAWRVACMDITSIVPAETSSKASYVVFRSANEVGYGVKFQDITTRREKKYDAWAERQAKPRCVDEAYVMMELIEIQTRKEIENEQSKRG